MPTNFSKQAFNIREALNSLKKRTGLFGEQVLRANNSTEYYSIVGQNRNLLINGNFRVSQRGNYSTATDFPLNSLFVDRWKSDRNISCTFQHITSTLPFNTLSTKSIKLEATGTNSGYFGVRQIIEDYEAVTSRVVTISAWVKSNNPNAILSLYYGDNQNYLISNSHSGNGQWEKLTVTGPIVSTPSQLVFAAYISSRALSNVSIVSGDYIEIADAQVELGTVATPFAYRTYAEELALCQRYLQLNGKYTGNNALLTSFGVVRTGFLNLAYAPHRFVVPMRTAPTVTFGGNLAGIRFAGAGYGSDPILANSGISIENASAQGCTVRFEKASGTWAAEDLISLCDGDGTGYIAFSAEL